MWVKRRIIKIFKMLLVVGHVRRNGLTKKSLQVVGRRWEGFVKLYFNMVGRVKQRAVPCG